MHRLADEHESDDGGEHVDGGHRASRRCVRDRILRVEACVRDGAAEQVGVSLEDEKDACIVEAVRQQQLEARHDADLQAEDERCDVAVRMAEHLEAVRV